MAESDSPAGTDVGPVPGAAPSPEPPPKEEQESKLNPAAVAEAEALSEERAALDAAALRPAAGRPHPEGDKERGPYLFGLMIVVMLVLGWVGGTAVIQLRKEVGALTTRLDLAESALERAEASRAASALVRARAELREAGPLLPTELGEQVRLVERELAQVAERLEQGYETPAPPE